MGKLGHWFGHTTDTESAFVAPPNRNFGAPGTERSGADDASTCDDRVDVGTGEAVEHDEVIAALRQVYDPEIPVNIYDLGLIYRVDIEDGGAVQVDMTLTAPGCPVAQEFPGIVEAEVCRVPGVKSAHVEIVWDPPWTTDRMSDEAKLELGML